MENNVYRETEGHGFPKVPSLVPHISNVKKSSSFKVRLVIINVSLKNWKTEIQRLVLLMKLSIMQ